MAFHVRTRSLNHSPQWYRDHCWDEDGGSPAFRAMLNADLVTLDRDDKLMTYAERVGLYAEVWDSILAKGDGNASVAELQEILEREGRLGYVSSELYAKPPFSLLAKLMDKHGLSTTDVGVFLKWTAKNANLKKARSAKKKPALKPNQKAFINKFLVGKREKSIGRDSEL